MPKYKVDFRVVRVQGNRAEVKDNNGKLSWYHISDIKKTNMVTKLICQLPDVDAFGRTGRLSFDPEHASRTLDGFQTIGPTNLIRTMSRIATGSSEEYPKREISPNGAEIQG